MWPLLAIAIVLVQKQVVAPCPPLRRVLLLLRSANLLLLRREGGVSSTTLSQSTLAPSSLHGASPNPDPRRKVGRARKISEEQRGNDPTPLTRTHNDTPVRLMSRCAMRLTVRSLSCGGARAHTPPIAALASTLVRRAADPSPAFWGPPRGAWFHGDVARLGTMRCHAQSRRYSDGVATGSEGAFPVVPWAQHNANTVCLIGRLGKDPEVRFLT